MVRSRRGTACVRLVREQAEREGWPLGRLVEAIMARCGRHALAAHRLARGWTLQQAVTRLNALRNAHSPAAAGTAAPASEHAVRQVTTQMLCAWERGRTAPSQRNVELLCRLYGTRPERLGIGRGYEEPATATAESPEDRDLTALRRRLEAGLDNGPDRGGPVTLTRSGRHTLADVRGSMDRLLTAPAVQATAVDHWEQTLEQRARSFPVSAPGEQLTRLVLDFAEVRQILGRRQPLAYQRRFCHMSARLAGLAAAVLVALGEHDEAQAWQRTARLAAVETGDRRLTAWVETCQAQLLLYYGTPRATLRQARQAHATVGASRDPAGVWAPMIAARALAMLGRPREAKAELRRAEVAFSRLEPTESGELPYGYDEAMFRAHQGEVYTRLGETRLARDALQAALDLRPRPPALVALVQVNQAFCLLRTGYGREACHEVSEVLRGLAPEHRASPVMCRTADFLRALPPGYRLLDSVREMRALLGPPVS